MGDTLTFDLVARDKSISSTFNSVAKSGDQLASKLDSAGKKATAGMEKSFKQAGKSGIYIERAADGSARAWDSAGKRMRGDLDRTAKAGKDAGDSIASAFSDALGGLTGGGPLDSVLGSFQSAKGGFLAAGVAAGGLLVAGIASAVERQKVGALVAAQTGQVGAAAGRMGDLAGDLFTNNFGESIQDAGQALTAVLQNQVIDTSASDAAIEHITEKVLTVGLTMDESSAAITRSIHTMMVNGVAGSASQALDIIQTATERGLNMAGDLLDTVDEYSVQFARMGLSGQEAFGLVSQAVQAGARDTDIAADAIKEFSIRAQDGSVLTARGFRSLGMNAKDMGARVAAGGGTARDALRDVLNALQEMPPGVARSTAAVDLFGTKAEDMGEALFHMDLDSAVREFGDFGGAVDDASATLSDSIPIYETWGKNVTDVLAQVGDGFLHLRGAFDSTVDSLSGVDGGMSAVRDAMASSGNEAGKEADAEKAISDAHKRTAAAVQQHVDTLDELINKQREAAGLTLGLREAESEYQQAVDDASVAIQKNGTAHGFSTEKGRDNNKALDDIAKTALDVAASMAADGHSTDQVSKKMAVARNQFINTAHSMGYTRGEAAALATKLGLIPGDYKAMIRALGIAAAKASVKGLIDRINDIPTYVDVRVNVHGNEMAAAGIPTGGFYRRAKGGPVRADSLYRVGEEGEEWFVPKQDGMIIPHDALGSMAAQLSPHGPGGPSGKAAVPVKVSFDFTGTDTAFGQSFQGMMRRGAVRMEVNGQRVRPA